MTGMPASIIFFTGVVSVPMPNAWMATKSHFCEAMLSIAARCLGAESSPSYHVISTFSSRPQYSAACLPCAHQVACKPALENAALSGLADRAVSAASAATICGCRPSMAAPIPAAAAACKKFRRRLSDGVLIFVAIGPPSSSFPSVLPGLSQTSLGRCRKFASCKRHWQSLGNRAMKVPQQCLEEWLEARSLGAMRDGERLPRKDRARSLCVGDGHFGPCGGGGDRAAAQCGGAAVSPAA